MKNNLCLVYKKLFSFFGPQAWWPGETAFEVIVGAILTQGTNWQNVQKAIDNLKSQGVLEAKKLYALPEKKLAALIRPCGYYNIKARRLRNFLSFFIKGYGGNIRRLIQREEGTLRGELLSVKGIGPETADSILLYALNKPVFVVDAYTKRLLLRHRLIKEDATYGQVQDLFMDNLKKDVRLFNEYHALIVKVGKDFCRKNKPRCSICPLK
ncbi:MAG: endonuclease III domain-containing protein [Candidatus Omnitrophica bacterium]|nr:endonuclease III domain-containing protein [Candidatus Omnitrophota bacterium]